MSEIENGSKLPSTPALIALSSTLDCSIDWILKGESPSDNNADVTDSDEELLLLEESPNLSEKDRSEIIEIIKIKLRKKFYFLPTILTSKGFRGLNHNPGANL